MGGKTQKKNSPRTETRLLGLPPFSPLVDVIGAGKLGSRCGHSLMLRLATHGVKWGLPANLSALVDLSTTLICSTKLK